MQFQLYQGGSCRLLIQEVEKKVRLIKALPKISVVKDRSASLELAKQRKILLPQNWNSCFNHLRSFNRSHWLR